MKKLLGIVGLFCILTAFIFAGGAKEKVVITSVVDLVGKKIGVQAGTTGELYVQENIADAKIASFKSGIDATLDLKNGTLDAVVLDELPAKEIVARNPSLMIVTDKFAKEEYAIAVKKDNFVLLNSINSTIEKMKQDGSYAKLIAQFMPADGNIVLVNEKKTSGNTILKLGTNANFPPFEYVDGTKIVGFDISMGHQIADDLNMKLEVVDMSFDSLIPALASGSIDFIAAGMSVTEERKQNVNFSIPYYESEQVIIIRK